MVGLQLEAFQYYDHPVFGGVAFIARFPRVQGRSWTFYDTQLQRLHAGHERSQHQSPAVELRGTPDAALSIMLLLSARKREERVRKGRAAMSRCGIRPVVLEP